MATLTSRIDDLLTQFVCMHRVCEQHTQASSCMSLEKLAHLVIRQSRPSVPWHKNFETVPVLKRGTATMQVGSFEIDRADVLAELERSCGPEQVRVDHSLIGPMSFVDWMRWGYLHTNHPLRQFGR
jgi:hypothetical protein